MLFVAIAIYAQTQESVQRSGVTPLRGTATLEAHTKPKHLQDVRAGMRFREDVVPGLGSSYKLTKVSDIQWEQWEAESSTEDGEIVVKDDIVLTAGLLLPTGNGDAASFAQELLKAFFVKTRPETDELSGQLGIRSGDAKVEVLANPVVPVIQRITFTFSDNSGYSIIVLRSEKQNTAIVQLEKFWK